jgi:UDP-N-acetylglucosamine pyrophosphorylase
MSNINSFIDKMIKHGSDSQTIKVFEHYYQRLLSGEKGKLSGMDIQIPQKSHVIDFSKLTNKDTENLKKLVIIKLNGGLGTSMGLSNPKSLLPVKPDYSFLDIIAQQTILLREKYKIDLPLIFMNSFNTSDATMDKLKKYPSLKHRDLPLEFIQSKFPKVKKEDFTPYEHEIDHHSWNPPGHGDIYNSLSAINEPHGQNQVRKFGYFPEVDMWACWLSPADEEDTVDSADETNVPPCECINCEGIPADGGECSCPVKRREKNQNKNLIQILIEQGYEYIFVSNSDNLGAVVSPEILNKMVKDKLDFVMEVCSRTENDKKGGHLAATKDGKLLLREVAQCPDEEVEDFQNVKLYKYFNTNNLWINLHALNKKILEHNGILPLDLILNEKKIEGTSVYQMETAMGAAISLFDKTLAVRVSRERFLPVKKNQDLLTIWSDIYELDEMKILRKTNGNKETVVHLCEEYYGNIQQLENACCEGVPSLVDCKSLSINGKVKFGKDVVFKGNVKLDCNEELYLHDVTISSE